MEKWEYKIFNYDLGDLEQLLNALGDEGWELVSVAPLAASHVAYLKRSK